MFKSFSLMWYDAVTNIKGVVSSIDFADIYWRMLTKEFAIKTVIDVLR